MNTQSKNHRRSPGPAARSDKRALDGATRMAKALSHPVRMKILVRLNETVASPNELAGELDEPLGNVSYHVRALLELDCVELVDTVPRRGAVEHYYRATQRALGGDEVWDLMPPSARHSFAVEWFKTAFGDARQAIDDGGFDERTDCQLHFTRLHLDERSWRKLAKRVHALADYALQLQAESAGRLQAGSGSDEIKTGLILAQYEAASKKRS